VATVLLVRHGRTTANATGLLAGRTPGVLLDEHGRAQAAEAARRLVEVPLAGVVTSPLERCVQTAEALVAGRSDTPPVVVDDRLNECDYGAWQNRPLEELADEELWKVVQSEPSTVQFPGGETMAAMQARAVAAIRAHDSTHDAEAVWVAVSHGDVIKSILADALGMHLDSFQRISVHPASVSIVHYGAHRPDVLAMNTEAGDLRWVADTSAGRATVGGGPGASSTTTT